VYRFCKWRDLGVRRTVSAGFDGRLFDEQLRSLRGRTRKISREPSPNPRYTVFVLRLLWVVVVVPFLAGAACAFLLAG
jgi:hypothetical protein